MTRPPVIVTRAQPGAAETAARLTELGYPALVSPALELVAAPDVDLPDPASCSGLVFTSANGVRFFTERTPDRSRPAWCVGPATAAAARAAGFCDVHESAGDAEALATFIKGHAAPSDKPLLHIANAAARGNLARALARDGRAVVFCPLYRAEIASGLTLPVRSLLSGRRPSLALFHSAKGAEAFFQLSADLPCDQLAVAAISAPAATQATARGVRHVAIASQPHEAGLLAALNIAADTLSA